MKQKFFTFFLLTPLFLLLTIPTYATFFPENDLRIGLHEKSGNSPLTRERADKLLSEMEELLRPLFTKKNARPLFLSNWDDAKVNAYAYRQGKFWFIELTGGLIRHPEMTLDALALIVCHEVRHHLGGAPKKRARKTGVLLWASSEGQSDYYATSKCLRRFFGPQFKTQLATKKNLPIPQILRQNCSAAFLEENQQNVCIRSALAGQTTTDMFASMMSLKKTKFEKPSLNWRKTSDDNHPLPQCRLDTYFAGAVCPVSHNEEFDDENPLIGACDALGQGLGARPRCWYAPIWETPLL